MNIIVTTPKSEIKNAAKEAEDALAGKVDYYFRRLSNLPEKLKVGDKVFYTEDGSITGFSIVEAIANQAGIKCDSTERNYSSGVFIWMRCDSWKWINPIPYKGFQGFRYTTLEENINYRVIGDWKDPKPKIN